MRRQFFVRLHRNFEGILTYVEKFLCKMTEKVYPKGTSFGRSRCGTKPLGGLCAVLPLFDAFQRFDHTYFFHLEVHKEVYEK